MATPNADPPLDEEGYVSSEDEDFDPTTVKDDQNISSESESEEDGSAPTAPQTRRKPQARQPRQKKGADVEDLGFENSGDEDTIMAGTKEARAKRKRKKGEGGVDEDSGGEGGFVKTRSMRAIAEAEAKKPAVGVGEVTVDIDALWNDLKNDIASNTVAKPPSENEPPTHSGRAIDGKPSQPTQHDEEMILIKNTYVFAGETTVEEKLVPKSSAQAQLYLQSQAESQAAEVEVGRKGPEGQTLYRPLKRVSKWEPNPNGVVKGLSAAALHGHSLAGEKFKADLPKAKKLNVVNKSKLDWAELVDKEGRQEELDQAAKAKDAYHSRVEFLGRVENKKEEELRNARRK